MNIVEILNKNVHKSFKIDDDIYKFLFDNADKEVFEYNQSKCPFTFIYSSHLKTDAQYYFDSKHKKIITVRQNKGDGTVNNTSQFYNGLRWILEKQKNEEHTFPVHLVEYCAENDKHNRKSYRKDKSQYISIGCDCIRNVNLDQNIECNHASMLNDNSITFMIKDIVVDKWKKEKISNYEALYNAEFKANQKCDNITYK